MKVLIAGGRGRVGSKVADLLEANGVEVVSGGLEDGVDFLEGTRVAEVMAGVDTIVNVLNTPRFDEEGAVGFFEGTTRRLTEEGVRAGVRHHILLSIVGVGQGDASDIGYYFGKVAQERALAEGPLPYTIVRSAQFQGYVPVLADQHTVDGRVLAPRDLIQPVELDELVALLVEVALAGEPLGEVEFAGPERFHLDDLLRGTLAASGDAREVVTVDGYGPIDAMVPRGEYRAGKVLYPLRDIPLAG
ncbi:NAD(P)H-binding protein [Leifsonia sp. F6_8S_P_1B]|uniref:NAD(P)H-binding protein n=1 Tax=Leifsonia williamsii TaxID=3035919 RepID=A0ABT8K9G4_9MICO|nr:NAD(P)H-binding protein [Leifsonia williamsii]MDN4614090.1 NAD(P)H-binding protein [Leifsonia williamsii]